MLCLYLYLERYKNIKEKMKDKTRDIIKKEDKYNKEVSENEIKKIPKLPIQDFCFLLLCA